MTTNDLIMLGLIHVAALGGLAYSFRKTARLRVPFWRRIRRIPEVILPIFMGRNKDTRLFSLGNRLWTIEKEGK